MSVERLRELRKQKRITQAQLAEMLNITYSAVSKYETADIMPPYETLVRMADIFGCSVDYLLGRDVPDTDVGGKQAKKEPAADDSGLDAYRKKLIETFASASPEDIRRILEIARLVMGNREV